jgi:beta-fructofuranosidase
MKQKDTMHDFITYFNQLYIFSQQADVEISFEVKDFGKVELLNHWIDPQILCSQKGASKKGGVGPFGLLVFASQGMQEYTAVFFRIFKYQHKNLVLMCSDQSRFVLYPFTTSNF